MFVCYSRGSRAKVTGGCLSRVGPCQHATERPPLSYLLSHVCTIYSVISQINEGSVVAVGPGRRSITGELIPVGVKAGDKVLLPEFGGVPVKLGSESPDGPEYFVFRDEELLGVLTE